MDFKKLNLVDHDNLEKKKCFLNLLGFLQHQNFSDLDGIHLFLELKFFQEILPKKKRRRRKKDSD